MNSQKAFDTLPVVIPEVVSPRQGLRSAGAVFAGLLSTFAITTAADITLHAFDVFPPFGVRMSDSLFALALAYRIGFNVMGAFVTARFAPTRPMRHALALGVTGVVLATIGAAAMGKYGPAWYSLANILIALPCAWFGGRLFHSRAKSRAAFISK